MAEDFDLPALLLAACKAVVYSYPPGTVGHTRDRERARDHRVGDFVYVFGALGDNHDTVLGELLEILPGDHLGKVYRVRTISGRVIDWHNVKLYSIPMGDIFGDGEERWRVSNG